MTVAAITAVLGGRKVLKRKVTSDNDLRAMTREGLPVKTLPALAEELDVERKILAKVVGISDRTLSRRLASGSRLSAEESDRTMRVARVVAAAMDTFGDPEKAAHWLKTSNRVMEGQTPLSLLDTDAGVKWVETILGRIAWGIYS
jgi:putative toxin-antitoxin system antitoxin component (TIGR02293 family)